MEGARVRVRTVLLTIVLVALGAPGASAQTSLGSLDISSKGLIDDNGFVTVGIIVDCELDAGAFGLEGRLVQRRGQQTAETTVFPKPPDGFFCAGEPRPEPIGFYTHGFESGPAVVSITACSAGGCETFEERITLHRAGENVVLAPGDPPPISVLELEVSSTGMIDTHGFVTVGTGLSCLGVGIGVVYADLVQRTGQRTAEASATRIELAVCFGGLYPMPVGLVPSPGSAPFRPGKARIELTGCGGGVAYGECRTIETTIKLRRAGS
jgi:hypothetical protein